MVHTCSVDIGNGLPDDLTGAAASLAGAAFFAGDLARAFFGAGDFLTGVFFFGAGDFDFLAGVFFFGGVFARAFFTGVFFFGAGDLDFFAGAFFFFGGGVAIEWQSDLLSQFANQPTKHQTPPPQGCGVGARGGGTDGDDRGGQRDAARGG